MFQGANIDLFNPLVHKTVSVKIHYFSLQIKPIKVI